MKKKVLIFINHLKFGGAEKVLVDLVRNINHEEFEITVLTIFNEGNYIEQLSSDVNYKYIFSRIIKGNSLIFKYIKPSILHKLFIKDDYDIEIAFLEGVPTRIISGCKNKNTKLIAWVHCDFSDNTYSNKAYKSLKEAIKCYKKFNKIICVSDMAKDGFCKLFGINKSVERIYNVLDYDSIIKKSKENVLLPFNNDLKTLCAIGRISSEKGIDRLLDSKLILQKSGIRYNLIIVGDGVMRSKLEERVLNENIEDLYFLGYNSNPYKFIKSSDMLILPSRTESFSLAIVEAMFLGKPVIATNCKGPIEICKYGKYGVLVENSIDGLVDGIKRALEDDEYINKYSELSLERGNELMKMCNVSNVELMLKDTLKQ